MNFLAHLYLSGSDDDLRFGNFIADLVKGKEAEDFSPAVRRGIALHRFIDTFTDSHPVWIETRNRIRGTQGKYAGVVTDIFYDHFLAKNWQRFHPQPLDLFASETYTFLTGRFDELPAKGKQVLPHMVRNNWLVAYREIKGIGVVLGGMSRRTPYASNMAVAEEDLVEHYQAIEGDFLTFFPLLEESCRRFVERNGF
jgi:acyl carrier protein phosphodiesterase